MTLSPAAPRRPPDWGGRAEARAFLLAALGEEFDPGRSSMTSVSVPAPACRPEVFLGAMPGEKGVLWQPTTGTAFAGLGAACRIDLGGPDRLRDLREQADAFLARLTTRDFPGCRAPSPRWFGGLAFAATAPSPPWEPFGGGAFTLPRWRYASDGTGAVLTLTLGGERDRRPGEVGAEFDVLFAALSCGEAQREVPNEWGGPASIHHLDPAIWQARIEAILHAIATGRFEKIVAARRSLVELPRPVTDTQVLWRLRTEQPGCTRFAFRQALPGGAPVTFLGATPERLIERRGKHISSEALAGSIARLARPARLHPESRDEQALRLLHSGKDGEEHALVVRDIAARLRPFCTWLRVPERPEVRILSQVLHLHTAIEGELAGGAHVLELVAALHPTPAVGGVPTEDAMQWIADHEEDRGWYAGPVGWFDAGGDGEFAVALRSGLLDGAGMRAYVYAGAGIVRGSDPQAEYQETAVKQLALLRALGAVRT